MKTDIATSHVLLLAVATAIGCDLGKGDDADSGIGDGPFAETGIADSGGFAESTAAGDGPWEDPSVTSTSGAHDEGCGMSEPTTGFDTESWGSSGGSAYDEGPTTSPADEGGSATTGLEPTTGGEIETTGGGIETTGIETTGIETTGGTGGEGCGVPFAPGNFEYACLCEDESCDLDYVGVAQIPEFYDYCNCLCEANGCGEAVGGVAEGGGEEG